VTTAVRADWHYMHAINAARAHAECKEQSEKGDCRGHLPIYQNAKLGISCFF